MFNAMFVSFLVYQLNADYQYDAKVRVYSVRKYAGDTGDRVPTKRIYLKNKANIRPGWNVLLKTLFTTRLKRGTYVASDCLSQ